MHLLGAYAITVFVFSIVNCGVFFSSFLEFIFSLFLVIIQLIKIFKPEIQSFSMRERGIYNFSRYCSNSWQ